TTANDRAVARLTLLTGCTALSTFALRADRVATALGSAFTTAVRVIDRVHCGAANMRATAHPTVAPGFADHHLHVIDIADTTDDGTAVGGHSANLTAGQLQLRPARIASLELG